jgi:hypothetical protein
MNARVLLGLGGLAVIICAAVYLHKPQDSVVVSNVDNAAIRSMVIEFGQKLRNVSLLAPDASTTLEAQYLPYIAPELLAKWQADPSEALGRQTSSPWPESINIIEIKPLGNGKYQVEANVIETTSASPQEVAAVYPVTMTIEKRSSSWLISSLSRGAYSELPKRTSIRGVWECLPHKDTSGPQTTECAFGIAEEGSGAHYAIDTRLMATYPVDYATGTRVQVSGMLTPVEQLNSIQKYDIRGVISATEIEKL